MPLSFKAHKLTVAALASLDVNDFPHLEILLLLSTMRTRRERKRGEEWNGMERMGEYLCVRGAWNPIIQLFGNANAGELADDTRSRAHTPPQLSDPPVRSGYRYRTTLARGRRPSTIIVRLCSPCDCWYGLGLTAVVGRKCDRVEMLRLQANEARSEVKSSRLQSSESNSKDPKDPKKKIGGLARDEREDEDHHPLE